MEGVRVDESKLQSDESYWWNFFHGMCARLHAVQPEQQAHAMSHPTMSHPTMGQTDDGMYFCQCGCGALFTSASKRDVVCPRCVEASTSGGRQHVSDAAWEAMGRFVGVDRETFESWHDETVVLTVAEHDTLLSLKQQVLGYIEERDQARKACAELRAEVERLRQELQTQDEIYTEQLQRALRERDEANERLRKGRDETVNNSGFGNSRAVGGALSVAGNQLDPRLGLPQPEGEPCEPMSAKRWRWLP